MIAMVILSEAEKSWGRMDEMYIVRRCLRNGGEVCRCPREMCRVVQLQRNKAHEQYNKVIGTW